MKFEELLKIYDTQKEFIKRLIKHDCTDNKEVHWEGYLNGVEDMFQRVKYFCDDFNPKLRTPSEEEKELYKYKGDGDPCELYGMLDYRGIKVPVYDDDYGQSLFVSYKGEELSGGTYNTCPEEDFCYWIDLILLKELKEELFNE